MTERRLYGQTGISLPVLALGTGQLGDASLAEATVAHLLNSALDLGVNLLDAAPSYGLAEERIGRHLERRRHEYVLSTKFGYGVPGINDWNAECIRAGVDLALQRLRTDWIDIAHLHSCPRSTLEQGEVIDALERAKQAGKVRAIAYSGEGEALTYALACGRFDGFMASLNVCDQRVIEDTLPRLQGRGFIAKRPLANAPWRFTEYPWGDYAETYWQRWQAMQPASDGVSAGELALRFCQSTPAINSLVLGTARLEHLQAAAAWSAAGSLPTPIYQQLRQRFRDCDDHWLGQV